MKLFHKYSFEIYTAVSFLVLYLFTRLFKIMSLPMFTDEAIYTRWAQIAGSDAQQRFISLTDGKQPSFVWADLIMMRFVADPLLAGRLVSVMSGIGTVVGIYFLGRILFKNKYVGVLASFLYILYPMGLVYDRMALYESILAMFVTWSIVLQVLLVKKLRLDVALVLGIVAGGAMLTKTSGFFAVYLTPLSILLYKLPKSNRLRITLRWVLLSLVAVIFAYGYYSILRLSPFFYIIDQKNGTFVYTFTEAFAGGISFFQNNIISTSRALFDWLFIYMSLPVLALVLAAFLIKWKEEYREKVYLFLWFVLPFAGLLVFGKTLYPRFIFFMTIPLLVLAAYTLYHIVIRFRQAYVRTLIVLLFLLSFLRADMYILLNFARAPIPRADLNQFINDWPAGGGLNEVVNFLEEEAENQKIFVASEGTFGSLPTWGIEIYLHENENVERLGIYPLPDQMPDEMREKAKLMPVYFVLNESEAPPALWPIEEIGTFQKGIGDHYMRLYQVRPE